MYFNGLKVVLGLIGFSYIGTGYAANQCNLAAFQFLKGDWHAQSDGNIYQESWRISESEITGQATIAKQNESKAHFKEVFKVISLGGKIYHVVKTPDNLKPVLFEAKNCQNNQVELVNPQHDFPQLIRYQLNAQGQLIASVGSLEKIAFKVVYKKDKFKPNSTKLSSKVERVKHYLSLFNQQDSQAMLRWVTDDIQWFNFYNQKMNLETRGKEALLKALDSYFASSNTQAVLLNATEQGEFISATEKVTWTQQGVVKTQCSLVVYQFDSGLIKQVWYYPAFQC
ncbi:DUF6265 family protein [Aliikangiella sp. IMCC44653]